MGARQRVPRARSKFGLAGQFRPIGQKSAELEVERMRKNHMRSCHAQRKKASLRDSRRDAIRKLASISVRVQFEQKVSRRCLCLVR
jgi:hypothetical protein